MLVGCAATASAPGAGDAATVSIAHSLETAQQQGFAWEVSVLDDGVITASEYEQSYDRYMLCQRDLGYEFDAPKYLDPVTGVRWKALSMYHGPGEAPIDDATACDERMFLIELPYAELTPERMAPELLAAFRACLDDNGISYRGDKLNFDDFTRELSDNEYAAEGSEHTRWLVDTAFELYPDLIGVSVGR